MHTPCAEAGWIKPAVQFRHSLLPAGAKVPRRHGAQVVPPATPEKEPAEQRLQLACPNAVLIEPGAQRLQAVDEARGCALPGSHS
jgi:hypothetical protein